MKTFTKSMSILGLSVLMLLTSCGSKSIAGTYTYKGHNDLINAEEDWGFVVAEDLTYTLSLTNDFVSFEYYGTVNANEDKTYTLIHTGGKGEDGNVDPNSTPVPFVYGMALDATDNKYKVSGNFDFEAKTFTPIVAA